MRLENDFDWNIYQELSLDCSMYEFFQFQNFQFFQIHISKTKTTPRATSEMVSLAYIKNNFGILFTCVKIIQNLLQVAVVRH